jgi:hypothetical protein
MSDPKAPDPFEVLMGVASTIFSRAPQSEGQHWEELIKPVAARISRIVALGVGAPSKSTLDNPDTFKQIDMIIALKELIDLYENNENESEVHPAQADNADGDSKTSGIPVFFSDPAILQKDGLSKRYLKDACGFEHVPYRHAFEDNPAVPPYYRIQVPGSGNKY